METRLGSKQCVVVPEMLEHLPEPVQRYLTYTGVLGFPWIETVHLRQLGTFRQGADRPWMPFTADDFDPQMEQAIELMDMLGDRVGPSRVQVLAHSLGTRGVMMALDYLAAADDRRPLIGPMVLIASDVDAATFADRLPRLRSLATSITLYASSNDAPLKASRALHGAPRLGEAGEFLTVAEGMQTIDVSSLGRYQIFGHEYHLFHPRVAADLATLMYTPAADATGSPLASFDFTVNDAGAGVVAAQMSINVTAVNDVPVATANTVTTEIGRASCRERV